MGCRKKTVGVQEETALLHRVRPSLYTSCQNGPTLTAFLIAITKPDKAVSSCTPTVFFVHPHNFVNSETDLQNFGIWECATDSSIRKWIMLHSRWGVLQKKSFHKLFISWLLNRKPNFYYGLADPEYFFQLWMFCIFLFWINTIIHILPETSIRKITRCTNSKIYRKH